MWRGKPLEVKINKEIQSYSESMFFGLSMRQCGFSLAGSTEPAAGMLIFFDWATQDGVPDHVGIVEKVENEMVCTIEGNSRDMCRQKQYALGSGVILGYGTPAS